LRKNTPVRNAALAALLAIFAFLHLYRMGELSWTWDEAGDVGIVECLQRTGNPFACLDDISQTRLPFYIHALLGHHYWISFAFSTITLLAVYAYARRVHGAGTATLFAALYVTSPALLASGRMVLTHSSIIFTCFTTLSFLALMGGGERTGRIACPPLSLVACAVFTGLAAASHILAAFNAIFLLAFYLTRFRPAWRDLLFIPIAAATFFATTVVYVSPPILRALIDACLAGGGKYPFWNYLGLGTTSAPWFFPFLLLLIKVGPWVVFAFHRQARWFLLALGVNLALKGMVFGYETPHHQVQFYPLLYLFIAVGVMRSAGGTPPGQPPGRRRSAVAFAVVALFAMQLFDVVRFFPNYLFYGAQYGERFIGEFYGPAVLHAQGRTEVWQVIEAIRVRDPDAKILVADNNMFDAIGPQFVPFTKRDPRVRYPFALVDRLYATHFHLPERDAYNAFLARHYKPAYTTTFPTGVWVYRVMELHDPATSPPPPARGHGR
jgi:hypothetical protein